MAIVATPVVAGQNYKSWNVTCLDADTTVAFNHGFVTPGGVSVAPDMILLTPLLAVATANAPSWAVTATSATQITLSKVSATGSGGGVPGTTVVLRVYALLPHSIIQ